MAATRHRDPPLEVWPDSDSSLSHHTSEPDDVETALLNALAPSTALGDASNKVNVQLNPSTSDSKPGSSPSKKDSSPLRPISAHRLSDFRLSPPRRLHLAATDSLPKNADFYSMYHQVAPKPERALFPPHSPTHDQENACENASLGVSAMLSCAESDDAYKGPTKRAWTDAAPIKPTAKKQKLTADEPVDLPPPEDMPAVSDDGAKPQHSYAELIGMAILRAPNRRLTLAQIYKWISDNFAFYRGSESGWQNSIRHNLSLNKNFIKQERPKDDPGKGNYWAIKPGEERPYLLGKKQPIRKIINPDGSSYAQSAPVPSPSDPASFRPQSTPAIGNFSLGLSSSARKTDSKDIDSAKFPEEAELSSDGTIPASDPALQEDDRDEDTSAMPPPQAHLRSSPPPADLGSSPPTMHSHRRGTPPLGHRHPSSSRSGGRRRKFVGVNDSGYWSSIESSAARGAAHQLASESELRGHRIKKGRAEAEIARIRSSSFDSPSKDHHRSHRLPRSFGSSPGRKDDDPLTPAVVFKRPVRPLPTTSPNTNLQDHRNRVRALLGSPPKSFSPLPENSWSPAFTLGEESSLGFTPFLSPLKHSKTPWRAAADSPSVNYNTNNAAFDIFIDAPEDDIVARGSPEKRSNRRPSLARAATSAGILADVTGTKANTLTLTSTSGSSFSLSPVNTTKQAPLKSPKRLGSPLKQSYQPPDQTDDTRWLDGPENPPPSGPTMSNKDVADLFGVELNSDGSEEGIDLFQDFGKIGQPAQFAGPDRSTGSPVKKSSMGPPARPGMARNNTTRW